MVAGKQLSPLLVIVGETGSGKTALSLELAERFGGEIICADSRTLYKGMDIGTAKPTVAERQRVPHFGLDLIEPCSTFTVFDFKQMAEKAIQDISSRGHLPILVGGSGLYIDAVLFNFAFRAKPTPSQREELENLTVEALQELVRKTGLRLPENSRNPRHLIRVLEAGEPPQQKHKLRPHTLVLGVQVERDELRRRIEQRVEAMVAAGLVDEVKRMYVKYGTCEALKAPGYKAFSAYLQHEISLNEAKRRFVYNDMQLAKKQRTWFKRNKDVHWLPVENRFLTAVDMVTTNLLT